MALDDTTFLAAISRATDANAVWAALEDLAARTVGAKLFTVMTVDMAAGLARRAYSNHPDAYPVSGTKPIHRDDWFDIVHLERRSFIANTIDDIAKVFPDYPLIQSLGCESVMNLPVVLGDDLVATINMLDVAGHYAPERVATAEAVLALPARLCCALVLLFSARQGNPA